MKNRKQAERTVIGMGQNLRLNCTAHLMQRLLLTAFFYTGSLGAGSWHISGGTVSPGICPGAAGAFSVYCPVCTCRETIGTFGAVAALAASHHTLRRNQSILDLEGTGSPGGGLLGLLGICQCAFGAHNGIRRAVYGPVSPYFRICRFSELVYSPVGATAHACSGA